VLDLVSNRIVAQADEAENLIGGLINGGAGGPTGLLWVRQGTTGIERRSRGEEDSERQIRSSLLESVQGEVEAVTGGRRMAEIMAAVLDASAALVTPTGRPRAGSRYASAIEHRDRLATEERRLAGEVALLRDALDERGTAERRLAELEGTDARASRRTEIDAAEQKAAAARAQADRLKTAEAELALALERRNAAERDYSQFTTAMEDDRRVAEESVEANRRREAAVERRNNAIETIRRAHAAAEAAEEEAIAARELLERLDAVARARAAEERREVQREQLERAEASRGVSEMGEAQLAQIRLPEGAVDELAGLDVEIARIRAIQNAARPSVTVAYAHGADGRITMGGAELGDGEERGYDGHAQLIAPGLGTITLQSNAPERDGGHLASIEERRSALLASMGVADLAVARAQQVRAQRIEAEVNEAKAQLAVLAPEGLDALREAVAALAKVDVAPIELKADPEEIRLARDNAEQRRREALHEARAAEPVRDTAQEAFVAAETTLAELRARNQQVVAILGEDDGREQRATLLADGLARRDAALADAQREVESQRANALDLEATEAALRRVRSVEQAAETEVQHLREKLAGLNARITARSDEAVEEDWRETVEALATAEAKVTAFEREIAVLIRLTKALEAARSDARELYLTPVMKELRPLLGLLFDDVAITFDDRSLLPQTIVRGGLEEDVDRLSGGMREQLSVLTRLAFARLRARDGRPAPVILDDALVYSDDDRIERMFDALHRQARDQQIIVFSCRQRAFQKLGGNVLQLQEWQP
jgi:DNA repair exonuclease SbcCD ATPase subunit